MDIAGIDRAAPAVNAPASVTPVEPSVASRDVVQAVKAVNGTGMFGTDNELQFQRDPQTQRMVVRLVNRKTKEVISQVPPEYVLRLAADSKHS